MFNLKNIKILGHTYYTVVKILGHFVSNHVSVFNALLKVDLIYTMALRFWRFVYGRVVILLWMVGLSRCPISIKFNIMECKLNIISGVIWPRLSIYSCLIINLQISLSFTHTHAHFFSLTLHRGSQTRSLQMYLYGPRSSQEWIKCYLTLIFRYFWVVFAIKCYV